MTTSGQGKKPEALKKVKDPELCQFIDKCLATSSKRLPARELLMDAFLQCEIVGESSGSLPPIEWMIQKSNDIDDLALFMEECHGKSATVQISYKLKETIPTFSEDSDDSCIPSFGDLKSGLTVDHNASVNFHKSLPTFHSKEEHARSVDFRVNGQRREDGTVFLKFRLADPEGQVRNIHFPFDVEGDTAMCVASEMVVELDLTDQDVTKIAEMIDAAILALVPEWKPGVAIDETGGDGEVFVTNACEDGHSSMAGVFDPLISILSEDPLGEKSPSFLRVLTPDAASPSKLEGLMHRRFQEVTYQCHVPEFSAGVAEEHCTVSSDSFDTLKGEDWSSTDGFSSCASQIPKASLPNNASISPLFEECSNRTDLRVTSSAVAVAAFNDLVESKRQAGCSHYTHVTWEDILEPYPHLEYSAHSELASLPQKLQEEACQQDAGDLQQFLSASPSFKDLWDWDAACNDKSAAEELTELALTHEKELRDLQRKHEEAISELRNRWQQKRDSRLSSALNLNHKSMQSDHNMQVQTHKDTDSLESGPLNLRVHEILCGVSTNLTNFGSARRILMDRCPSQGMQVCLPYDTGTLNDSMASCDDVSSHGQATPISNLKASGWHKSVFTVNPIVNLSTDESLYSSTIGEDVDYTCSMLQTQNPIETELGTLCIPIKAQIVEQMV